VKVKVNIMPYMQPSATWTWAESITSI